MLIVRIIQVLYVIILLPYLLAVVFMIAFSDDPTISAFGYIATLALALTYPFAVVACFALVGREHAKRDHFFLLLPAFVLLFVFGAMYVLDEQKTRALTYLRTEPTSYSDEIASHDIYGMPTGVLVVRGEAGVGIFGTAYGSVLILNPFWMRNWDDVANNLYGKAGKSDTAIRDGKKLLAQCKNAEGRSVLDVFPSVKISSQTSQEE